MTAISVLVLLVIVALRKSIGTAIRVIKMVCTSRPLRIVLLSPQPFTRLL